MDSIQTLDAPAVTAAWQAFQRRLDGPLQFVRHPRELFAGVGELPALVDDPAVEGEQLRAAYDFLIANGVDLMARDPIGESVIALWSAYGAGVSEAKSWANSFETYLRGAYDRITTLLSAAHAAGRRYDDWLIYASAFAQDDLVHVRRPWLPSVPLTAVYETALPADHPARAAIGNDFVEVHPPGRPGRVFVLGPSLISMTGNLMPRPWFPTDYNLNRAWAQRLRDERRRAIEARDAAQQRAADRFRHTIPGELQAVRERLAALESKAGAGGKG